MNQYLVKIYAILMVLVINLPVIIIQNPPTTYEEIGSKNNLGNANNKIITIPQDNEKSNVILQSFYWAVPNGSWYNTIASRMNEISNLGFTYIWLPPPSKTYGPGLPESNGLQVGYEPYDYYDLGEYNQQGSIITRYGSKADLLNLINLANNTNISVMADIVLNHNRGGTPYPDGKNFTDVKSGLFLRNASDFDCGDGPAFTDNATLGTHFPDLCTTNLYVRNEILKWGHWLYDDIGYRGWRFDYTIGYNASTVKAWVDAIGGLSMVEYWQNDVNSIMNYLSNVPDVTKALDFPLMYTFIDLFSRNGNFPFKNIVNPSTSVLMTNPKRAVTFVDNHDTVRTPYNNIALHRDFMYAFILLYDGGTPAVFWKDLYPDDPCFDPTGTCAMQNDLNAQDLKLNLRKLLEIRKDYAQGTGEIIYSDNDLFIYQRDSQPGLILAMNDNPNAVRTATFSTKYSNTILYDLTGKGHALKVDEQGKITIQVPPLSYLVYSQTNNLSSDIITEIGLYTASATATTTTGFSIFDSLTILFSSFAVLGIVNLKKKKKNFD